MILTELYKKSDLVQKLRKGLEKPQARLQLKGAVGSMEAAAGAAVADLMPENRHLFLAASREDALYLLNDIENLLDEARDEIADKRVLLFPTDALMRSEVVKQLAAGLKLIVVTYAEALAEKVVSAKTLAKNTLQIARGAKLDADFVIDVLQDYGFERVDFVVDPGQYAVRGGIIDVFSFAQEYPYRLELFDDCIDSLRTFDPTSQLSVKQMDSITVIPDHECREWRVERGEEEVMVSLLDYFDSGDVAWVEGLRRAAEVMESHTPRAANEMLHSLLAMRVVEVGSACFFNDASLLEAQGELQPAFNKQFDMLKQTLDGYLERGYAEVICVSNDQQKRRLERSLAESGQVPALQELPLRHGFIDHGMKLLCFTDHEIFERYHKYSVRDMSRVHEAITLKELFELKPGDFVTHIDYGVGRFSGLEKMESNGRVQEVIRLIYKNNDVLYVSIHALHKIARYVGQDGTPPTLHRLGGTAWQTLKQKTKRQVKDIAKDLIALYAKRKASKGFAFSPDSYLQNELEASFIYEDTPDQLKATLDVKGDMESRTPMDRLVCGDVGFGKTEVAIRAAFKACCDSKQVAVLVPSTILAFQHYNTFSDRLRDMPVRIDYLNRFRTAKEKRQILKDLEEGRIDILIGTHALTGKEVKFKDLGLLIIDEEQKFGVASKEKIRQMKVNVDCLTLTATPIPRTLQFSLMGARDLSVIQTPPPNRQPIETQVSVFDEEVIRDAIRYEMERGGQVFFVSNRVENLPEMAGMVSRLVPSAHVAMAHGQMDGKEVEKTLMRFLDGEVDVLVATALIENGLDIPNANTMIINNAQQFGLSDLHQMRGRVGRSNRKAFCHMLIPSYTALTPDAQKRLHAIEEFSSIGSGFNLAMRDLDIRGAGNILGAEQSGFISEVGYETYQKILNEAIEELKETDFKELFHEEMQERKEYARECVLDTDIEALLPDSYVTSISERLLLYKELNSLSTEEQLDRFCERLIDRFGPIPRATQELVKTITLRRLAKEFGIERLVLRQDRMVCHFPGDQENPFYASGNFSKLIRYVQANPHTAHLKESTERLFLSCDNVHSIHQALSLLQEIAD